MGTMSLRENGKETEVPPVRYASVGKHFQEGPAELQIPPLRYAPVGMTKGRVVLPFRLDARGMMNSRTLSS
jgi:hypothetical protein